MKVIYSGSSNPRAPSVAFPHENTLPLSVNVRQWNSPHEIPDT